jgi:hypothetical protein
MFGRVYLAERTDVPEHRVALKVMVRAACGARNVERELVMLAAATHPHIVQLKDHGMTSDYVWLTMPLYEGETLAARLERGPLSLREAHDIFLPIARGVESLHERGLRHQDIKPENIFLAELGAVRHPVLLDLGVAVEVGSPFVAGTALYGAPEQVIALGRGDDRGLVTEKVDTYCLASTLLRAIVGEEHFPGETAVTPFDVVTAFARREESPLAREALPALGGFARRRLASAFSRWLCRDPDDRPGVGTFADELGVLLEQEREQARARDQSIARQRQALVRVRWALAAVAILGLGAGGYAYAHRSTLRLARELAAARAAGQASFDELDTCVAAHELARRELDTCEASLTATSRREEALAAVQREGEAEHEASTRELERARGRAARCQDDARKAAEDAQAERDTLAAQSADAERSLAETRRELDAATAERDACRSELGAARGEANGCMSALLACEPAQPAAGPPATLGPGGDGTGS